MIANTENNNNTECYICLDNINFNENDFLELNCCKNNLHLKCLKEWCTKNNTSKCFICNQTNEIYKELAHNSSILNNIHYVQTHPTHPTYPIHPTHPIYPTHPIHIIYIQNKLTGVVLCFFFVIINLFVYLSEL